MSTSIFCTDSFISRVTHQKSSKCIVLPIVAFCLIYNIPKFFEIRTKVPGENNNNTLALEELNSTILNGKLNLKWKCPSTSSNRNVTLDHSPYDFYEHEKWRFSAKASGSFPVKDKNGFFSESLLQVLQHLTEDLSCAALTFHSKERRRCFFFGKKTFNAIL